MEQTNNQTGLNTGTASLIFGILSIISCLGPIFGIPAIILGAINKRESSKTMASVGIIMGILSTILIVIVSIIAFLYETP